MIITLKKSATALDEKSLASLLSESGLKAQIVKGELKTVVAVIGDTSKFDADSIAALPFVSDVKRITEPYRLASRTFCEKDTIVKIANTTFGGGNFAVIAGPCSVESEAQIFEAAKAVKDCGAGMLRGGAFKPRTSPYSFQGSMADGLKWLVEAGKSVGLPVVSEITDQTKLSLYEDVDMLQIGARNMQNFALLKEVAAFKKPVLLKRGFANTVTELLLSAEYLLCGGLKDVVLAERGIRTFDDAMRFTPDIGAIVALKELTHLPIVFDPSHAAGNSSFVSPLSLAATAAGTDGLTIEVHPTPETALSDGLQAITPAEFGVLMDKIKKINCVLG